MKTMGIWLEDGSFLVELFLELFLGWKMEDGCWRLKKEKNVEMRFEPLRVMKSLGSIKKN